MEMPSESSCFRKTPLNDSVFNLESVARNDRNNWSNWNAIKRWKFSELHPVQCIPIAARRPIALLWTNFFILINLWVNWWIISRWISNPICPFTTKAKEMCEFWSQWKAKVIFIYVFIAKFQSIRLIVIQMLMRMRKQTIKAFKVSSYRVYNGLICIWIIRSSMTYSNQAENSIV